MTELNFPAGYIFGEHGEYMILRSAPLSRNIRNTFSEVYLAVKTKTRKKFAVKVLRPSVIRKFDRVINDFQAEIKILMELNHRYIIKIEDFGTIIDANDMPSFYLVTEFIPHGNILSKEYTFNQQINFSLQVCEGLAFIHKNNIIHRDIKPDNILVYEGKIIKIVDFGIAKFYSDEDMISSVIGAPAYAAQEQISKSQPITHQVDIYSLGKTIYTMITKIVPPPGVQITELPEKYLDYPWSKDITYIIKRSTELAPSSRYKDVNQLKNDLKKLYQKSKIPKFIKRKRVKKSRTSLKITFALLLFIFIFTIGYSKKDELLSIYRGFRSIEFFKNSENQEELLQKGVELFNLGYKEYNQARIFLEKAVKLKPDDPRAYPYLGTIYSELGMLDKSIISWQIAVRLNSDNLKYKINLGKTYFQAGKYREALREWKSVLEKDPFNKTVNNLILVAEINIK